MIKNCKKLKGFSLVELILAIGIFATVSSMLIFLVIDATKTLDNTQTRARATNLVQEINTAILLLKDQSWQNISANSDGLEKHLELVDGEYQIADGQGTVQDLTYHFTISNALRDSSGNLDPSGDPDPHTRVVNISILWNDSLGREQSISPKIYINDWNTHSLIDTFVEDFNLGTHNGTYVENFTDGEVSLEKMLYSDWCRPSISTAMFDIYGNGVASSISTYESSVIMGTGGNASGVPFVKATVTENFPDPPEITQDTSYTSSDKTNDVFLLDETYGLLATDTSGQQVMIMDMTSPVQMVGNVVLDSAAKANNVSAYNDKGFVTERNNLIMFDLSSNSGSRPILETVSLGGNKNKTLVTDIYLDEQYIYMTMSEHTTDEFVIYEYSPSLSKVGQISLGDMSATALFISEDKTKAFIGTENNALNELFIVDITDKAGTYSVISSLDLGGMSVNALISIDNRIMIGGQGGQQYQVIEIDTLTAPTHCGGLTLTSPVYDISLVQTATSNYSYIVTGNSDEDLQIIRGGLGGGGADGNGYLPNGEFISQLFDTESSLSEYYMMVVEANIPTTDNYLKIQLRAGDTTDLSGSPWVGPDNTSSSYYEYSNVYNITPGLVGRYFQYKAIMESDTKTTPLLEQIVINYEK